MEKRYHRIRASKARLLKSVYLYLLYCIHVWSLSNPIQFTRPHFDVPLQSASCSCNCRWKIIIIAVFYDELWRMSVEGVNVVAGQELKDPLGQPASPAQPGASQKWAFPLTALCAVQCAPCCCSHYFRLSTFSASLRCAVDFSIAG